MTQDTILRFYNATAAADLGAITINGTLGDSSKVLSIIVANGQTAFPTDPTTPLTEGVKDAGAIVISDADLRDNTRVAIAATGDQTGSIAVGHVFRLQLAVSGGEILAPVTATAANDSIVTGFGAYEPMAYVHARKRVAADLVATAGDIGIVSIGNSTTATDGLQANIKAEQGQIGRIFCAGPIGNAASAPAILPQIYAGKGINQIRAIAENAPGTVLARDFHADIKAGLDIGTPLVVPIDAPLHLIETQGDLTGSVEVANVAWDAPAGGRQWGILVGGAITAPITIKYNLEIADIIAASIDAPITIGVSAKGAIVATDPLGQILSIEVGYANEGLDEEDEGWDPVAAAYGVAFPRGFKGSACRPVDPHFAAPFDAYTREDWTSAVVHCFEGTIDEGPFDSGSTDSVIRAPYIGSVRLATMTNFYRWSSTKSYFPRVESPEIGVLEIGILHAGVVWSGNLHSVEGPGGWEIAWDPEDAYSKIGAISIGCITGGGDLWVDGTTRVQIDGDMLGQIHVPTLTDTIWIGGRLGLWSAFGTSCAAIGLGGFATASANMEDSPRDSTWTDEDTRARGEIVIREVGGLPGQVIINGNNDGGTWNGAVIVGDELGAGRIVITPSMSDPEFDSDFHAPHYHSPSGPLGGGAVGLAPFAFYPTDCTPPDDDLSASIMYDEFAGGAIPVRLRWYGPVELPQGEEYEEFATLPALLNLHCRVPGSECGWHPLEAMFNYVKHPDGEKRAIGI